MNSRETENVGNLATNAENTPKDVQELSTNDLNNRKTLENKTQSKKNKSDRTLSNLIEKDNYEEVAYLLYAYQHEQLPDTQKIAIKNEILQTSIAEVNRIFPLSQCLWHDRRHRKPLLTTAIVTFILKIIKAESKLDIINMPDQYGLTALHYAAMGKNEKCVRLLVENGASINVVSRETLKNEGEVKKNTPMHFAVKDSSPKIVKLLLESKDTQQILDLLKITNERGQTPLEFAIRKRLLLDKDKENQCSIVTCLLGFLEKNAQSYDKYIKNDKCLVELAISSNNIKLIKYLFEFENKEKVYSTVSMPKGLRFEKISKDGHCLFHAVGLYVGQDQQTLRNLIAARLRSTDSDLLPCLPLREGQSSEDYLKDLENGKEWADHIEINVLMRLLDRPIIVLGPDGTIRNKDQYQGTGDPIFVYYNGHNHYDALLLEPEFENRGREILDQLTQLNQHSQNKSLETANRFNKFITDKNNKDINSFIDQELRNNEYKSFEKDSAIRYIEKLSKSSQKADIDTDIVLRMTSLEGIIEAERVKEAEFKRFIVKTIKASYRKLNAKIEKAQEKILSLISSRFDQIYNVLEVGYKESEPKKTVESPLEVFERTLNQYLFKGFQMVIDIGLGRIKSSDGSIELREKKDWFDLGTDILNIGQIFPPAASVAAGVKAIGNIGFFTYDKIKQSKFKPASSFLQTVDLKNLIDSLIKSLVSRYKLIVSELSPHEAQIVSGAIAKLIISSKFFKILNDQLYKVKQVNYDDLGEKLARFIVQPNNKHIVDKKLTNGTVLGILRYSSFVEKDRTGLYKYYSITKLAYRKESECFPPRIELQGFKDEYEKSIVNNPHFQDLQYVEGPLPTIYEDTLKKLEQDPNEFGLSP